MSNNLHLDMQEMDPDMKKEEVDLDLEEVRVEQKVLKGVSHQVEIEIIRRVKRIRGWRR